MTIESHISQLNGYLKALQRLCGNRYVFGASHHRAKESIDNFFIELIKTWSNSHDFLYSGYSKISYQELTKNIEIMVFNGILKVEDIKSPEAKNYIRKAVIEDINEYYGLASISENKSGIFHPLIEGPVHKVLISNKNYSEAFFYVVKICDFFVVTYMCKKA